MSENKKYYSELNIFRGLIIIWVVIGHSFISDGSFFGMLTAYAYTFHMASFFMLSGLLFASKLNRAFKLKEKLSLVLNRFKRLLVPYFFFTIVSYVLKFIFADYAYNEISTGKDIIWDIIFCINNPNGGLWFLYNLFLFSVIAIIFNFLPKAVTVIACLALNLASLFFLPNETAASIFQFTFYLFFFYLGTFVSSYYEGISEFFASKIQTGNGKKTLFIITFVLALFSAVVFLVYNNYSLSEKHVAYKYLPCCVNIILWYFIALCLSTMKNINKPINTIGNYGMDIYMIGYYVQISIRVVFGSMLGLPYLAYAILMLVFGLILPIPISKYIIRKVRLFRILVLGDFSKKEKINGDKRCLKN